MFVELVSLTILIVFFFGNHPVYSLDMFEDGNHDGELVGIFHRTTSKRKSDSEKKYPEVMQYNLNLLKDLVHYSDRFSVFEYQGRVFMRCEWGRDLNAHDGSCAQFLLVEAGISVENDRTLRMDSVAVSFLLNQNDFRLFLSRLQSILPMEWLIPVNLYDVRGPNHINTKIRKLSASKYPPRYVVANLRFPSIQGTIGADTTMDTTLDLGNSKRTILMVDDCRGCVNDANPKNGCPDFVPTCATESRVKLGKRKTAGLCWKSNPNQSVPAHSFEYTKETCSHENFYNDKISDAPICRQCFQNGEHSRFVAKAKMKNFSLTRTTVRSTIYSAYDNAIIRVKSYSPDISNFNFGALIRTIPLVDRIWSNVGIGAGSDFLSQLNVTRLMIDFDYYTANKNSKIIFNPSPELYKDWDYARYDMHPISANRFKRIHAVHGFFFEQKSSNRQNKIVLKSSSKIYPFEKKVHFHIDTGNDGISIADKDLKHFLANATGGQWINHTLYTPFSPDTAPDLYIDMSLGKELIVDIPGSVWSLPNLSTEDTEEMRSVNTLLFEEFPSPVHTQTLVSHESSQAPGYPTIFSRYHKNVFGLPFLSSPGFKFVFDDKLGALFVKKNVG